MDKSYILEHSVLEQYLLGNLTAEKQIEIERVLNTDSELKEALTTLEANFEKMSFENAIIPPIETKAQLMQQIKATQPKVIPLQKPNLFKNYLYIASGIAASLLIGSVWMLSQLNETNQQLQITEKENETLLKDIESLKTDVAYTTPFFEIINSPETEQYILLGNDLAPDAKVVSYVNHQNKSVIINTQQLPKLDSDHDYQMWADVDGEMISMGVINKENKLLAMNYIEKAESLNITIEPAGGNNHPTVSRLVTNIYLR